MRSITFLCCVFLGLNVFANDTLTRAQVYNFSVGDTFDYFHETYTHDRPYGEGQLLDSSTGYLRYVISGIFYSSDSSTKYIQRLNLYPNPNIIDTIILQNLNGQEVILDSGYCFTSAHGTILLSSTSSYNGRTTNSITLDGGCFPSYSEFIFADGLGQVIYNYIEGGCGPCGRRFDSTALIYYNKSGEIWGSPYTDFPTGIPQLNSLKNQVSLFPALNDGTFNVKLSDPSLLPIDFTLYDLTGKKIEHITLNNLNNELGAGDAATGIYIWTATSKNQIIQKGKMVIH